MPNIIFSGKIGGYRVPITQYKRFKRLLKKADLPSRRLHDLRHSYAALRLQNGDDIYRVSKQIRHQNIQITVNLYGKYRPPENWDQINIFARSILQPSRN